MQDHDQRYLSNVERQQRRVEAFATGKFAGFKTLPKARNREELAAKMGVRRCDIDLGGRFRKLADEAWAIYSKARTEFAEQKQKKAAKPKADKPKQKKGAIAKKHEAKKAEQAKKAGK